MHVLSHLEAHLNLEAVMNRVVESGAPTLITRQDAEAVVMVSLSV